MSEYTPTTEQVRSKYGSVLDPVMGWKHSDEWTADFDRWLRRDRARERAEALEEAAMDLFADEAAEREWLLYRAARIRSDAGIGGGGNG